ncbi:hypothetical protein COY87_01630 [Candidatus Roizmanbacteria bacterium CG_4_10_14_0_8_um_filter_33_9]|uniref:Uncharacterized protein n=1 Tax=Candidatus Roizmanbacteria bacterium CG_4_10_14_0_8_um_filter_33_9 TaxID=1974826 RepID=A0A2M7QJ40_9BACT|nr:MAG: hypothetical protein COY87_01630 [Candidatus Roizmanbacteria bacterium CG_4_10_14_0_8_um_filter_33_9]
MITDKDIEKMKVIFATKEDLKTFASKADLKRFPTKDALQALDEKMGRGFVEIINFVGAIKDDIKKELNDFRGEVNELRNEMRDISRNSQSILDNHEARISHLEYTKS